MEKSFTPGQEVVIIGPAWHPRLGEVGILMEQRMWGWTIKFSKYGVGAGWNSSNFALILKE